MTIVKKSVLGLAALMALTIPASAVTLYSITPTVPGSAEKTPDGIAIGPYTTLITGTGALNQTLGVYCDDLESNFTPGTTYNNLQITNVGSVNAANSRFYGNPTTNANVLAGLVPTGTSLYQQLAWLGDHLRTMSFTADGTGATNFAGNTTAGGTSCGADTNCQNEARAAIQEAMWNLTVPTTLTNVKNANGVYNSNPAGTIYGDPLANSTNANFNYDAGTLVNGINTKQTSLTTTGANAGTRFIKDTVLSWETAAATYASTDSSVDYSKWFVIYGGGIDGANTSVQELLVYNFAPVGVPEPGSMVLMGSAMLACAALIRRARKN